jgi:hypothetical protein
LLRIMRLVLVGVLLVPFIQALTVSARTTAAGESTIVAYDNDAPEENHAWQPKGQSNVLNPLGGDNQTGQLESNGIESLEPSDTNFDARTLLNYGATGYDAKTDPAYSISKYATQTKTPGQYDVTLTAKGNSTTTTTAKPLEIVFVVDMSGSMEQVDGKTSSRYSYTDNSGNRYIRSARHRKYFSGDTIPGYTDQKYEQYVRANAKQKRLTISDFRFKGDDGNWYAYSENGRFRKLSEKMSGPTLNTDYSSQTRASYVRTGLEKTLDLIKAQQDSGQLSGNVSVGLVGYSDKTFTSNDTEVALNNFSDAQATAMKQALDPDFSGGTWTQNGLERGAEMLQSGDANANRIMILLTDGQPTFAGENGEIGNGSYTDHKVWNSTIEAANNIKNSVHIQGISIDTPAGDQDNFKQLTSNKPDSNAPDYVAVENGDAIADALMADVKFDIEHFTSPSTISNGRIDDPLGAQYNYVSSAGVEVTGSNNVTDAQLAAIQDQVRTQIQSGARRLSITGLNLGKDQSVKITYQVQLQTETDDFQPGQWYPMNGVTTLTPDDKGTPSVNFGIPSGRLPATSIKVTKHWQDLDQSKRPDKITVNITRGVQASDGTVTKTDWIASGAISASDNWEKTFKTLSKNGKSVSLPEFDNQGHRFVYRVVGENQDEALTQAGYQLIKTDDNSLTNKQFLLSVEKFAKGTAVSDDNILTGAEFTLTDAKGNQQVITDDAPYALQPGRYQLQETQAPKNYKLDHTVYNFTVGTDGTVTTDAGDLAALPTSGIARDGLYQNEQLSQDDGAQVVTFIKTDEALVPPTSLTVLKVDSDTHTPLSGAAFDLSGTDLAKDASGTQFSADEITLGRKYQLTESRAPDGYVGLNHKIAVVATESGAVQVALDDEDAKTLPTDGTEVTIAAGVEAKVMTTGTEHRNILITVGNHHKGILPHTGSNALLKILGVSVASVTMALLLMGLAWQQRQKEGKV